MAGSKKRTKIPTSQGALSPGEILSKTKMGGLPAPGTRRMLHSCNGSLHKRQDGHDQEQDDRKDAPPSSGR